MAVRRGNTLEIWTRGLRLGAAWWILSDSEDKEQYRTTDEEYIQTHKGLMQADLLTRLFDGELKAYGIQVSPQVDDGPKVIPNFLFSEADIDWDASSLKAFGRIYEGVRVDRPLQSRRLTESPQHVEVRKLPDENGPIVQNQIKPKLRQRSQLFPAAVAQIGVVATANDLPGGTTGVIGRPSVIDHLRGVVREVATLPRFSEVSRKEQKNIIRDAARERYPQLFPRLSQPSPNTIDKALRAEELTPFHALRSKSP
jgi:hypothetical protein